ncbi:hypothetical protein [Saccharopolyspora cebuensis]|uniref:Uncharacterized protein n=1 Tax=Saccharopolyspora cebuensis TaxID=418759 RepID=A0ABV4CF88_9PSEU
MVARHRHDHERGAMGLLDRLAGTKRPENGITPRTPAEVRTVLLGLNARDKPFAVLADREADLVAEWKIADARWSGYFGNVTTINRTLLRLDPERTEVRALDQEWSVTWIGSSPELTLASSHVRGQVNKKAWVTSIERDEHGNARKTTRTFSTGDLKPPLQDAVTGAGWTWRGVLFGKL